jgi:hypothetical protein
MAKVTPTHSDLLDRSLTALIRQIVQADPETLWQETRRLAAFLPAHFTRLERARSAASRSTTLRRDAESLRARARHLQRRKGA